jgi:hypothetical protein
MAIHQEGLMSLRTMLLGTSNKAYGKKKMVKAMLYCAGVSSRSTFMPATLAFPMLERSMKERT